MRERSFRHRLSLAGALLLSMANVAPAQGSARLTPAQAQQDFDVARKALEEAHGALYRFTPKPEMDRKFDELRARANKEMSRREFLGIVFEVLSATGDGHAAVDLDSATRAALDGAPKFPLQVVLEGTRLVVTSNDTPDDATIRPGMEILSVNGQSVEQLLTRIMPTLRHDGFIETGRRVTFGSGFANRYWLTIDTSSRFAITARAGNGTPVSVTLPGVANAQRTANNNPVNTAYRASAATLAGPPENISLRFVGDSQVALPKVRGFGGNGFPASLDSAVRLAVDRRTPAMILDLRGNGGGVDMFGVKLVSEFTDKPFRYFDYIHLTTITPSFTTFLPRTVESLKNGTTPQPGGGYRVKRELHEGVAEQPPASRPFLGKLVVLIDGATFSTAADVTAMLRSMNRATFIGEETGGAYEGNTSGMGAAAILPNSRTRVMVQMYGYVNAVRAGPKGRGTLPDIEIAKKTEETLRGVDVALNRAIEVARSR